MAGQIIKAKVKRDFVVLKNSVAQDEKLSWQALGLLTYLLSLPDDWVIHKTQLYELRETNGRTSTDSAFSELEEKGYIFSVEKRDSNGHFKGFDYIVYNSPQEDSPNVGFPQSGFPQSGFPQSGNQHLQKKQPTKEITTKEIGGQNPHLKKPTKQQAIDFMVACGGSKAQGEKFWLHHMGMHGFDVNDWTALAQKWFLQDSEKVKTEKTW